MYLAKHFLLYDFKEILSWGASFRIVLLAYTWIIWYDMNALIFMVILIVQAIAEKRILLNDPSLLQSQIHALERKMEDVVGKYTYLSVKYANLSSNYKDLSTKNNDQPQSTPTCPLDTLTWLPHTTTNFLNTTTCPPNTIRCRPKLTVCFYASHWR